MARTPFLLAASLIAGLAAMPAEAKPVPIRSAKKPMAAALPRPLRKLPAQAIPLDGVYAAATEAAVRRYQWLHGLQPTGFADPATIWRLGLVIPGALGPGCRGTTVRDLQRALRFHDRQGVYMRVGLQPRLPRLPRDLTANRPAARVAHRATPKPVAWPAFEPPKLPPPAPLLLPPLPVVASPLPTPAAMAPIAPVESGKSAFDAWANAWFAPVPGAGAGPLLYGGGALWLGDLGVAGEYTLAPDLGGQAAGDAIDAGLRYRGLGPFWLGAGFRQFAGEPMGGGGLGLDQPLGVDWLRLRLQGQGYSNFGSGWLADGRAGLVLSLGPVTVEGAYRAMVGDAFGGLTGLGSAYAPAASAGLRF